MEKNEEWEEQGIFYFAYFMDVNKDTCLELEKETILKTRKVISYSHEAFRRDEYF